MLSRVGVEGRLTAALPFTSFVAGLSLLPAFTVADVFLVTVALTLVADAKTRPVVTGLVIDLVD